MRKIWKMAIFPQTQTRRWFFMDMPANILGTLALSAFSAMSSQEVSSEPNEKAAESGAPLTVDAQRVMGDKTDAKLERIKEEIKKAAVLPSSDEIVSKYGVTKAQAQQVLSEVCMEIATDAGGSLEQITQTANNMYMLAEMSDSKVFKTFDATELMQGESTQDQDQVQEEKTLSAEDVSQKYDITLEQAQGVLDTIKRDEEGSNSAITTTDLSAMPTYSISNSTNGQFSISLNNSCSFALSTVAYSA